MNIAASGTSSLASAKAHLRPRETHERRFRRCAFGILGTQMARRLLAFALAFVVIGGPLAGDVCAAVCAKHEGHSTGSTVRASPHHHSVEAVGQPSHHHHSDAAAAPAALSARLMPLPHGCGHFGAIISESRELTPAPLVKAVLTMPRITSLRAHVLPPSDRDSLHGPPTSIRSISPLRT